MSENHRLTPLSLRPQTDPSLFTPQTDPSLFTPQTDPSLFTPPTRIAPVPDWLVANRDALSGKVSRIPTRDEMQPMVNEQLIVELYSR